MAFGQGLTVKLLDLTTEQWCERNLLDLMHNGLMAVALNNNATLIGLATSYEERGIQPASCPLSGGCFSLTPSGEGLSNPLSAIWVGDRLLFGHDPTSSRIYQFSLYDTNCALLHKVRKTTHQSEDICAMATRPGTNQWAAVSDGAPNDPPDEHNWVYWGSVSGNSISVSGHFATSFRNAGVCWSANAAWLVVGSVSGDNQLAIYNGDNPPQLMSSMPLTHGADHIAFSSDNHYLAVAVEGDTTVTLFDSSSGSPSSWSELYTLQFEEGCTGLEWLPGTHILVQAGAGQIQFAYLDDSTPPSVNITSPPDGHETIELTVTISGQVSDASGIQYAQCRVNGGGWTSLSLDSNGHFSQQVALNDGGNLIEIQALDGAGRWGGDGIVVTRLVDTTPPIIANVATSPTGVLRPGALVTIGADVTDGLSGVNSGMVVAHVQFPDEHDVQTVTLSAAGGDHFSGTWSSAGFSGGTYLIDVSASDVAENPAEAENAATVALNQAPSVQITAPATDQVLFRGDTYTLAWTSVDADDDALTSLYLDTNHDPAAGLIPIPGALGLPETTMTLVLNADDFALGTYYVYAMIADPYGSTSTWAVGTLQIALDFGDFAECMNGPDVPYPQGCENADFDVDADVDLVDFAAFQIAFVSPPLDDMVLVPAGEFQMGDSFEEGNPDERPVHLVYLDAFYIDRYETRNQEYAAGLNWARGQNLVYVNSDNVVLGTANGVTYCHTSLSSSYSQITWDGSVFGVVAGTENYPMAAVTWYGAAAYCNWRSAMEGTPLCYDLSNWTCNFGLAGYRLPTEAEWEKAAAWDPVLGYHFRFSEHTNGCGPNCLDGQRANYLNSGDPFDNATTPVGYYDGTTHGGYTTQNAQSYYECHDLSGNISEWCYDWYGAYPTPPQTNPIGPSEGEWRVFRGGSWNHSPLPLRSASRNADHPYYSSGGVGLRCVSTCE